MKKVVIGFLLSVSVSSLANAASLEGKWSAVNARCNGGKANYFAIEMMKAMVFKQNGFLLEFKTPNLYSSYFTMESCMMTQRGEYSMNALTKTLKVINMITSMDGKCTDDGEDGEVIHTSEPDAELNTTATFEKNNLIVTQSAENSKDFCSSGVLEVVFVKI